MVPKKTQILAYDFFHELIEGRPTSADKILQSLKGKTRITDWQRGYLNALEGMLAATGSKNDKSVLINQIDNKETNKLTKIFSRRSKDRLQSEFDRGFFEAWVDYTKTLKNYSQTILKI
ncbi:MAG: hypothetical protein V1850_03100 [Candidatus Bathyarchaeota archaeon]